MPVGTGNSRKPVFLWRDKRPMRENGRSHPGVARFFVPLLLILPGWLVLPPVMAAVSLAEIERLVRAGAPQLALRLLDQQQGDLQARDQAWLRRERQRIGILQGLGDWEEIRRRLHALPETLPPELRRWADEMQVQTDLRLGDGRAALPRLRRMIWATVTEQDRTRLRRLRRQLIRAYLAAGAARDAHIAMLRYQQDYGRDDAQWRLLHARVLMQAGRDADAAEVLQEDETPAARALYLLAQWRAGRLPAARVREQAEQLAAGADAEPQALLRALAVVTEQDAEASISALESWLAQGRQGPLPGLLEITADDLWRAYRERAMSLGNRHQLLIGDEDAWFALADEIQAEKPASARAIHAWLATQSVDHAARAQRALAEGLERLDGGLRVLKRLYLPAGEAGDPDSIPVPVRYRLAALALREGEISLASRLMQALEQPPRGEDPFNWTLRRARVFIADGRTDRGVELLQGLLERHPVLDDARHDRLMQVVFDLQAGDRHEEAIGLFDRLMDYPRPLQSRRELLFWKADSLKALGRKEQAAWLYLRSATLGDAFSMDAWARTARYHAAEMLAGAGLAGDARSQFEALLEVTREAGRRAMLQHQLQKLRPRP